MRGMLRSMKETHAHISCLRPALNELSCGRPSATPLMIYKDSKRSRLEKGSSEPFRAEVIA